LFLKAWFEGMFALEVLKLHCGGFEESLESLEQLRG
jgi:hypothetical protein